VILYDGKIVARHPRRHPAGAFYWIWRSPLLHLLHPYRVGEADEALKQRLRGMLHLTSLLELKPDEAEALPAVAPIGKFLPGWNSGK
jgi:hypothetical protein